jgi:hypothetical protein
MIGVALLLLSIVAIGATTTCSDIDVADLLRRVEALEARRPVYSSFAEPKLLASVRGRPTTADLSALIAADSGVYALELAVSLKHEQGGHLPHVSGRILVHQADNANAVSDGTEMSYAGNEASIPQRMLVPWDATKAATLHFSNAIESPFMGKSRFDVLLVGVHLFK